MRIIPTIPEIQLVCLLVLQSSLVLANETPLTLGECIRRALERGFAMHIEQQDLAVSQEEIPVARSVFRPVLSASTERSVIRNAADALLPQARSEGFNADLGVSQFLWTGASIGVGVNVDRSRVNPALSVFNPAYASDLTFALRQPLLQGLGTAFNTSPLRRAEIGYDNAWRDYRGRALETIQATENAYYLLAGRNEQLAVFDVSLQLAEKLLEEAKIRKKAGMATGLDALQAEVGVANARRGVLEARNAVKASEDALLALIGRFEFDTPLGSVQLDEQVPDKLPQVEASYALAEAQQPELLNARAAVRLIELDISDARNRLLPVLDLDVAFDVNGRDGTGRDAFSDALANEGGSWRAGFTLIYPWGRSAEKARFRQAEALLRRQRLSVQQLEQDILVRVRNAVRDVETGHESVKLATMAADLSERQYEQERKRFKAGLSTSRRVLEAQTDLEGARVARLQAKFDLQIALAALRRIEGSALEYYGIDIAGIVGSNALSDE